MCIRDSIYSDEYDSYMDAKEAEWEAYTCLLYTSTVKSGTIQKIEKNEHIVDVDEIEW